MSDAYAKAMAILRRDGVLQERDAAAIVAGGPIRGSWWGHPRGREIFSVTRALRDSEEILVCRLVGGKVTFVHRSRWPALARLADRIPRERLARVREVHTPSGAHSVQEIPFPDWVPEEVRKEAAGLSEAEARRTLGRWLE